MADEPIRCPFCAESVTAIETLGDYAYLWSIAIVHLDGCPKRPGDLNATEAEKIAGTLIENHLNRYF